jgi:hypothetical protein
LLQDGDVGVGVWSVGVVLVRIPTASARIMSQRTTKQKRFAGRTKSRR